MKLSTIEYIGAKPRKKKRKKGLLAVLAIFMIVAGASVGVMKFGVSEIFAIEASQSKRLSIADISALYLTEVSNKNTFVQAALVRTTNDITYDPAYYNIDYPMGDIPSKKGVCSDVIVRTYRDIGIDLQQLVHEDMGKSFESYPQTWGLKQRDHNIDHRRVPNLQHFFSKNGESLTISTSGKDYQYGDIVTWKLSHGAPHIGIVVPSPYEDDSTPWVVHNVGSGPQWENCLFDYKITGHYRYQLD